MTKKLKYLFIFFIIILISANSYADISLSNDFSTWISSTKLDADNTNFRLQYIPTIKSNYAINEDNYIDYEVAGRFTSAFPLSSVSAVNNNINTDFYRCWVRYSQQQFETRVGLQKINFGPAKILRTLKWFDTLNPMDPLNMSDGVNAVLSRYFFLDNSNVWIWLIDSKNRLKGSETDASKQNALEYGGRYQFPVPMGEYAFTLHSRKLDTDGIDEYRYAMDGHWDVEVGLWFESQVIQQRKNNINHNWSKSLTLGIDYTFNIGSGLYTSLEYYYAVNNKSFKTLENELSAMALNMNLPITIIDSLNSIVMTYQGQLMYMFGWQGVYDEFLLYANIYKIVNDKGIQVLLNYNF
jgi:hypothetical protein